MCDGSLLNFMEKTELYSLITNALSNAIKAVENLPDDKRIVDFTLAKKNGIILLEIDNYFDGEIKFSSSNLPISTKTDGKNHGFGSKSISYIVIDTTEHYPILPTIKYSNYLFHFKNPSR